MAFIPSYESETKAIRRKIKKPSMSCKLNMRSKRNQKFPLDVFTLMTLPSNDREGQTKLT